MWRSIFNIIFSCLVLTVFAQQQTPQEPKENPSFKPFEIKLGFNGIRAGRTAFGSSITTHEIQGILALHQYNIVLDVGTEKNVHGETYTYENKGSYFRFGADWNFVKDRPSGNVLSLGLRYARASFQDEIAFTTAADQGFGAQTYGFSNPNLNARWFEVAFNLRGKIVSNFYMGFTMRWQAFRKLSGEGRLKAFDIPGFGETKRENSTAFDYYLMWRIPFTKK